MLKLISSFFINGLLLLIFSELVFQINSQQIVFPLKLMNSSYSKYSPVKNVFIKAKSLEQINCFNSFSKKFLVDNQQMLSIKIDILNSLLFGAEIEIGSNSQKFNVILDTGSQILWVPEINSINSNTNIKNFYNPTKSTTAENTKKEFEVVYGTGYCQGYFYKDLVKFLSSDKYFLYFGSSNNSQFEVEGAEGILGLARTYPNDLLSPLLTLKNNGIIKTSCFSFKYDHTKNSLFMYAGKPHNDFSTKNIAFCNLLSNSGYEKMLWACKLDSFGFIKNKTDIKNEENIFINSNTSIIFDTGTNFMLLPYELIFPLKEKLKKYNCIVGSSTLYESDDANGFIICFDIERIPDISLQLGDYILILNKYKMFYTIDFGYGIIGYLLNVQFQKQLWTAIIGQNFFTEFHTLFDPENKVLKFYSESKDKIINLQNNKDESNHFGIIFVLLIIIILIGVFIYYRNQRRKNLEGNYEWMGPNDGINLKYNNIN